MRKRFVLMACIQSISLLFLFSKLNAQVFNGNLTLTSQAEIDAFNYTQINGNLFIRESVAGNITNLDGLSELTTITGGLVIGDGLNNLGNTALTNLNGLSNLVSVSNLGIFNNASITNIDGLSNLESCGTIFIEENDLLTDLDGLSNVSGVADRIQIVGNDALLNIDGLSKMTEGNIHIRNNPSLVSITGLSGITLASEIEIENNNSLTSLNGLQNSTGLTVLEIAGNSLLTSLAGLPNVSAAMRIILIINNDALTNIDKLVTVSTVDLLLDISDNALLANLDALQNLVESGDLRIESNGALTNINGLSNLHSIDGNLEIISNPVLADVNGLSALREISGDLSIIDHPLLTNIDGLSNLSTFSGRLEIVITNVLTNINALSNITTVKSFNIDRNESLLNIDGLSNLVSVAEGFNINRNKLLLNVDALSGISSLTHGFQIANNPVLNNLNGLSNLTSTGAGINIINNDALINLDGLVSLATIGGPFTLSNNDALTNIDGLTNLASIGGICIIAGNDVLTNLDGLHHLNHIGFSLIITDNLTLVRFCGLYTLLSNNGLGGAYTVTGNGANPTQQEILNSGDEPPTISEVSSNAVILSPPNHKMHNISINYGVTGGCGLPSCSLSVTSNEPVNGTGDGDTDPDWLIIDDHHLKLRAERAANGNGRVYTVTITCTDILGNKTTKTTEVRVAHNITGPQSGKPFKVGSTVSFTGEFWDKPGNSHTAKWLLDGSAVANGIVSEPAGNQKGKVTGSYKFRSAGVYKLQMNITDQNGIVSYANTNEDLDAIVVIYDPNGGHAYGGGYYNSPAGALISNPSAAGKASYGFAMNYFKNSTNPKGETQFEFKVGDFEFNALNFDYLVINNSMAQFKGTGKIIGGQSGIGFTMTVVDGQLDGSGIDKIRMKIYNKNNGSIIYDNQPGASDAALPAQAVGTNSTVVISGSNSSLTSANTNQKAEMEASRTEGSNGLDVKVFPNPSASNFTISIKRSTIEKLTMQVVDMYGRVIETRIVNANSIIQFGDRYRPGTYLVRIMQDKEHKEIKLIKLSD